MKKKLEQYTKEELIEAVKSLKRRKKSGLVWEDKPEDVVTVNNVCDSFNPYVVKCG